MYYVNMRTSTGKTPAAPKKAGRPATGQDPVTSLRLPAELLERLDRWIAARDGRLSRSAAIRAIIERALG